jgi:hypothetical protein
VLFDSGSRPCLRSARTSELPTLDQHLKIRRRDQQFFAATLHHRHQFPPAILTNPLVGLGCQRADGTKRATNDAHRSSNEQFVVRATVDLYVVRAASQVDFRATESLSNGRSRSYRRHCAFMLAQETEDKVGHRNATKALGHDDGERRVRAAHHKRSPRMTRTPERRGSDVRCVGSLAEHSAHIRFGQATHDDAGHAGLLKTLHGRHSDGHAGQHQCAPPRVLDLVSCQFPIRSVETDGDAADSLGPEAQNAKDTCAGRADQRPVIWDYTVNITVHQRPQIARLRRHHELHGAGCFVHGRQRAGHRRRQ